MDGPRPSLLTLPFPPPHRGKSGAGEVAARDQQAPPLVRAGGCAGRPRPPRRSLAPRRAPTALREEAGPGTLWPGGQAPRTLRGNRYRWSMDPGVSSCSLRSRSVRVSGGTHSFSWLRLGGRALFGGSVLTPGQGYPQHFLDRSVGWASICPGYSTACQDLPEV